MKYNVSAALGIGLPPEKKPAVLELVPPAESFRRNISRVISSIQILPDLIELAGYRMQFELQCLHGTGTDHYGYDRTEPVDPNDIEFEVWKKMRSVSIHDLRPHGAWPVYYQQPRRILDLLSEHLGDTRRGFEGVLMSAVVQTWTGFETLAGDLWRAAINAQPRGLADLKGMPTRIEKRAGGSPKSTFGEEPLSELTAEKSVSLSDLSRLTKGEYDVRHRMGDLLWQRFSFATLRGIRRAYSTAFSQTEKRARTEKIDAALADRRLDALNSIRNLIVHKAGLADQEYVDAIKAIPTAPKLTVRQPLELDGELVRDLVNPVILCGVDLIEAVNTWLVLTGEKHIGDKPSDP